MLAVLSLRANRYLRGGTPLQHEDPIPMHAHEIRGAVRRGNNGSAHKLTCVGLLGLLQIV